MTRRNPEEGLIGGGVASLTTTGAAHGEFRRVDYQPASNRAVEPVRQGFAVFGRDYVRFKHLFALAAASVISYFFIARLPKDGRDASKSLLFW
jgi:hypothetical protein